MFRRRALRRKLSAAGCGQISDSRLAALVRAADAGADGVGGCVPGDTISCLAALRVWRWPDVRDLLQIRRLPMCTETECCNPYHWSRLCEPDTPPPPYTLYDTMDEKISRNECSASTEDARRTNHERFADGSLTTDGEERLSWNNEWCKLAYWELARRVGRQFGVRVRSVDVFAGDDDNGPRSGLSLDELRRASVGPGAPPPPPRPPPERVRRTRAKIGLGVTISLEPDGVWLYNRSNEPVFASSASLGDTVWRVPAGHCLRVHSPRGQTPAVLTSQVRPPIGPRDDRSVRVSFAKGWGGRYSRRDVTACPCWLEVLLAPS